MQTGRGCPLCGTPWHDYDSIAECLFCATAEPAEFQCEKRHTICEDCRTGDPREVVVKICAQSKEVAPLILWDLVTSLGIFRIHGPQFHFVVGPILAVVLRNRGFLKVSRENLKRMAERLSEIPALSCSKVGVCGAGANAGAVISLVTGATLVSDIERRSALQAMAQALAAIARHPGGRCCRQSALASLVATWGFLRRELHLPLEEISGICRHFAQVPDCKKECAYHG